MSKRMRQILTIVLMAVCLISTGITLSGWSDARAGSSAYANAEELAGLRGQSTAATEPPETALAAKEPEATTEPPGSVWVPAPVEDDPTVTQLEATDLQALRQVNEDVVGWILIPDTAINFPIVQGEDNAHYLDHTWDGKENRYGSIFLECMNSPDMTNFNTIIYGHNMNDGAMFGSLVDFSDPEYRQAHPYVYIVTDGGVFRYEIFSSYDAPVESATYILSFNQEKTRVNFLQWAVENSEIDTGIVPATTDRIITLSTCTGLGNEYRRVVHARLEMIETYE